MSTPGRHRRASQPQWAPVLSTSTGHLVAPPRRRGSTSADRGATTPHENGAVTHTAAYYALTYLGFAAPYLLTLAEPLASYPTMLGITAALALATAVLVRARCAALPRAVLAPELANYVDRS